MDWRPTTYLTFATERTRPALELLARVAVETPRIVYDLGCGPGNSTAALVQRWTGARVIGVDNSEAMLAAARRDGPRAEWRLADVREWMPDATPDVIYSNATFQWIPQPEALLPRLMRFLGPGGVLAFQVPANHDAPPHTLIDEALDETRLSHKVPRAVRSRHVLSQADYYQLLAPFASTLDVWDTEYLQVVRGKEPVLDWIRATALLPVLSALNEAESQRFTGALRAKLNAHYPPESGGETLFPFKRRFVIAVRA